ncbi:MAG: tRNA (N6-isopentenyl adenosine(37)-C2)-methylthiotransferase MiaB [Pyrinomonadaceae bacterium]
MKKVYIETYGCQMNVSDSERVGTHLTARGFELTTDEKSADVILINTCSVREKAEQKLFTRAGQIRLEKNKPMVGVLGCVAQLEGETLFKRSPGIDFVLGTKAVGRVSEAIEKVLNGKKNFIDLNEREFDYDWSVSENQRHSPYVAFVPIIEGCNKFCTYCIVPFARGREKSLSPSDIILHVSKLRSQGVKEIHLIGQNVNSYRPKNVEGLEKFRGATPFSRLLRAVAATGIERIKFTTSFPRDFHPDIVDAIDENENLCNWVHLPVQSGSNEILKIMRRGHTIEDYLKKINKIKNARRKISISTDIIVGFPSESKQNFKDTLELAEYSQFDSAYIFKYSPRPGTPAFNMPDDVPLEEKTKRFIELESVVKLSQLNSLQKLLNKTVEVLAEKISAKNEVDLSGHTTCHKVVNFKGLPADLGKIKRVFITVSKTNTLYGDAT